MREGEFIHWGVSVQLGCGLGTPLNFMGEVALVVFLLFVNLVWDTVGASNEIPKEHPNSFVGTFPRCGHCCVFVT